MADMNRPIGMKGAEEDTLAKPTTTPVMNVGARLVKTVASKTMTATVPASAIFQVWCKAVATGNESHEHQTQYGLGRDERHVHRGQRQLHRNQGYVVDFGLHREVGDGCVTGFKDVNTSTVARLSKQL